MITLITGAPGSGKTLYCIDKIIQPLIGTRVAGTNEDGMATAYERVIYTNINGLMLPHEMVDAAWLEKLHENKQTGAVVVFDEVQRVWPNRPTGSKKPPAVEYLETHRHDGIDVVLLTQNPQLLDPAVRALIGRHLHMRRVGGLGASVVYEWDLCSNSLNFKNAFRKAPYRYSRKVFELYKSAKVHTKQTRSLPFAVWIGLAGLALAGYMVPKFFDNLDARKLASTKPAQAASSPGMAAVAPSARASGPQGVNGQPMLTAAEYLESHRARMKGLPHTAPRFDQITQATRAPVPAACIQSKSKGCKCWSQDATPMWLPDPTCRQIVAEGLFLDFKPEGYQQAGAVRPGAVHWGNQGQVHPAAQIGAMAAQGPDGITAGDIAATSRATYGGNPWAKQDAKSNLHKSSSDQPKV